MGKGILMFIGGAIAYFGGILFGAFVLLKVWGWYIVPGFGAPELTMFMAVGLKMVASTLTSAGLSTKSDYGFLELVALGYFVNLMILIIAYVTLLVV